MTKMAAKFMELGYEVFTEMGDNSDIDLILIKGNELKKVQIKTTATVKNNAMTWEIAKRRLNYSKQRVEFYDDKIDGFGLYCLENNYMGYIDLKDVTGKYSITFRLDKPARVSNEKIKLANVYEL